MVVIEVNRLKKGIVVNLTTISFVLPLNTVDLPFKRTVMASVQLNWNNISTQILRVLSTYIVSLLIVPQFD